MKGLDTATPPDITDLITQAEAARLREVSREAIRALVRRNRLQSIEMFGKRLVYRSEVLAFEPDKPGPKKDKEESAVKTKEMNQKPSVKTEETKNARVKKPGKA